MSEHKRNVTSMKVWWLALIILLFQTLMLVDSKFDFLYPDSNDVVFETETLLLICKPPSNVSSLNVSVSDAQGSNIVQYNRNVSLKVGETVAVGSTQLLLVIIANSESRSSLTCIIFENGTAVSEDHLNLDIRPKDQPACLMRAGPAVEEGDIIELTCYEALSSTTGNWSQIRENGINVDLPTVESTSNAFNHQFKQRHTSSITVSPDDDGSVFACDVEGQRCVTDEITIVNELTLGFTSESPERLKINEQHMVECNASQPSAQITWNHDYEANNDVLVIFNDSFLYVTLPSDTTLRHGHILNFTCVATLLRFEASGTYRLVVDLTASNPTEESTTSNMKDTTHVTEKNTKSAAGGSTDDESVLYFIIGGIAAVILVALIIITLVALCVVEAKISKKDTKHVKPNTVAHVVDSPEGASSNQFYSEVTKDTNRASTISRPDSVLYTDINKGHVLIDEEEIYNENLDWERLNGLSVD